MNATFKDDDAVTVEDGRKRLGELVKSRRTAAYGTIEAAIRAANVNRQTWERVESGERVWDSKLRSIVFAVGLDPDLVLHYLKTGEGFEAMDHVSWPLARQAARVTVDGPGGPSSVDVPLDLTSGRRVIEVKRLSDGAIIAAIRGVTESDSMSAEERIEAIRALLGSVQVK